MRIAGRFFHPRLVEFIASGPLRALVLSHTSDAITTWRGLLGPTKSFRAHYEAPASLRGQYGASDTRNVAHGSDSPDSVRREVAFFFPQFDWTQHPQ